MTSQTPKVLAVSVLTYANKTPLPLMLKDIDCRQYFKKNVLAGIDNGMDSDSDSDLGERENRVS